MFSFFNREIRQAFIQQEFQRPYYCFSEEGDSAYTLTYKYLKNLHPNSGKESIDRCPGSLTNQNDPIESGREFTSLLPTHTLKMYDTFLRMENEAQKKDQYLFLDAPSIYLVDVGCGGGSASVALLMLIANYQKYRNIKGLPIYPINIRLLGIDPNAHVLSIYEKFLLEMQKRIAGFNINVSHDVICGKLSEQSDELRKWLKFTEEIHLCYFVFGNVIRPQEIEFNESQKPSFLDTLKSLINRPRQIRFIGEADIDSIIVALDEHLSDKIGIIVVSSSTSDGNKGNKNWFEETNQSFKFAFQKIRSSNHDVDFFENVKRQTISILATSSGFYRNIKKNFNPIATEYNVGYAIFKAKRYAEIQTGWGKVIEKDNLKLAWARVRNDQSFANLEDTLEFRFFETNINDRIEQLYCRLLFYDWQVLGTEKPLHFKVLKGEGKKPRPMSVCRIEEQIVATAFLQSNSSEYKNIGNDIFAYQISPDQKKENLYIDWFNAHNSFINTARKNANENPTYFVIKTDLSSFYTSIDQNRLYHQLCDLFSNGNPRIQKLLHRLVIRDCGINQPGKGIIQGHIISGAFSNIYLLPVDQFFSSNKDLGIFLFRYVDDMILIFPPRFTAEDVLTLLRNPLTELDLTLSLDKTSPAMTVDYFLDITAPDVQLEVLTKEFNYLMVEVYKLRNGYLRLVELNKWGFLRTYQKALSKIGYFISVARLNRKISKYLKWWERLTSFPNVNLPEIKDLDDLSSEEWKNQFEMINSGSSGAWIDRRKKLQKNLIIMFNESYQVLSGNGFTEKDLMIAKRRFKASVNRLGKLGFESTKDTIVDIVINKPWLLDVRRVCEDLALQDQKDSLISIIQSISGLGSDSEYVRSCVYKAFAYLPHMGCKDKNFIEIIKKPTFSHTDETTISEKTMSSEALFFTRSAPRMSKMRLQNLFNSDCLPAQKRNMSLLFYANHMNGHSIPLVKQQDYSAIEASQYEKIGFDPDILYSEEPDILKNYYESDYPDNDLEFPEKPS